MLVFSWVPRKSFLSQSQVASTQYLSTVWVVWKGGKDEQQGVYLLLAYKRQGVKCKTIDLEFPGFFTTLYICSDEYPSMSSMTLALQSPCPLAQICFTQSPNTPNSTSISNDTNFDNRAQRNEMLYHESYFKFPLGFISQKYFLSYSFSTFIF